jgi:NADH-quinone oxidoreductase subunit M
MINISLIIIPIIGMLILSTDLFQKKIYNVKLLGLIITIINFFLSLFLYILFDYSNIEYQFTNDILALKGLNINIGIDGISLFFILLITFISTIVILSN